MAAGMDEIGVRAWFDRYLAAFAACGRGASDDLRALSEFYGVPLLVSTDDGAHALTTADDVLGMIRLQVDGMRAAGYDRSETLASEVVALNATSALLRADFARVRADGGEIGRFGVTYLIAAGPAGRRIWAMALHAP